MNTDSKAFSSWEDAVIWLREQPDQQELVTASYYDDPLITAAERYYNSEEWQAIMGLLSGRSGSVLDVGAGRGIASYALARAGFDVTALEPDSSNLVGGGAILALSTESGLPISVVQEVSEELPFIDSEFDVVFARAVLHHMRDLGAGCSELARVLKPGGILVSVREHVITRNEDLPEFLVSHPLHHLYGGENAYLLGEYRTALKLAGLNIVRQLKPLESPINYSPHTHESLRKEIVGRVCKNTRLENFINSVLRFKPLFSFVLRLAALFDNRPGRLYSFVCEKPV